uniref:Protein kinase domain-containing protein n=1 Tax=Arcella intermedia TaxID=1963864 RepID=A0A6B2KZJ3_9EUKA
MSAKLGSGTFGTVYRGSCRGTLVAIKVLKVTSMNIEDILQEVGMMSHLRFQNIVTMHGVSFHEDNLYIISEYLPCGDLEHWLMDKDKEISFIMKLKLLKDVAMGMNWLHSSDPPVIHRDLKPANVLLTTSRRPGDEETIMKEKRTKEIEKDLMAKVTDMGLSKVMTIKQLKADGAGSNLWMAPELLKYQYYDEKVDVYSFALLIWQVLTWTRNPFQDYLDRGDLNLFVEAVYYRKVRPEIPKGTHPRLVTLMNAGWAHHAKDRPEFSSIVTVLDDCMVTTLFKDERYAIFWQKNWGAKKLHKEERIEPAKEKIPFATFAEGLYDYLSQYGVLFPANPDSDVYYLCLKVMVVDPKFDAVTIDRLLLVEKWFGPLLDESWSSPTVPSKASVTSPIPISGMKTEVSGGLKSPREKKSNNLSPKHSPRSTTSLDEKERTRATRSPSDNSDRGKKPKVQKVPPRDPFERPEERTLLGTLRRILEQQWFHGDISKEDADSTLATSRVEESKGNVSDIMRDKIFGPGGGPAGDFLIRLSFSEPVEKHPFTITKVDKRGVIFHQRIFYEEESKLYKVYLKINNIPEVSSDSLHGLVKQLTELQAVRRPCKRLNYARKYDDIFQQKEVHDKGYLDQGYLDQI